MLPWSAFAPVFRRTNAISGKKPQAMETGNIDYETKRGGLVKGLAVRL